MLLDDKLRQAADEARSEGKVLYGELMDEAADALQSKRDQFAGQALALGEGVWPGGHLPMNAEELAKNCYLVADAMLQQSDKEAN